MQYIKNNYYQTLSNISTINSFLINWFNYAYGLRRRQTETNELLSTMRPDLHPKLSPRQVHASCSREQLFSRTVVRERVGLSGYYIYCQKSNIKVRVDLTYETYQEMVSWSDRRQPCEINLNLSKHIQKVSWSTCRELYNLTAYVIILK